MPRQALSQIPFVEVHGSSGDWSCHDGGMRCENGETISLQGSRSMAEKTAAVSNEDAEESNADVTEDLLVEEVSIDGMCGVY